MVLLLRTQIGEGGEPAQNAYLHSLAGGIASSLKTFGQLKATVSSPDLLSVFYKGEAVNPIPGAGLRFLKTNLWKLRE